MKIIVSAFIVIGVYFSALHLIVYASLDFSLAGYLPVS